MHFRSLRIAIGILLLAATPCAAQLQPRVVALENQLAPGTTQGFDGFSAPTISSTGEVGFYAGLLHSGTPATAGGMWSEVNGTLALVARSGSVPDGFPPGSGFVFTSSVPARTPSPIVFDGGQLVFGASMNNQSGTWRGGPADNLQAGIYNGLPAPTSAPGTVFAGSSSEGARANASGQFISIGTLQATTNAQGIWTGLPGSLDLVARQGFSAAGTTGNFAAFSYPVLSDTGIASFTATLGIGSGVTTSNNAGVWRGSAGNLDLLARKGDVAPGTGGQTFSEFRQVSVNDAGTVAISAKIASSNRTGLWNIDGDSIDPVFVPGQAVPGLAGDVNLLGVGAPVINGQGAIAFEAFFGGADAGIWQGQSLWVHDGTDLRMLAKAGDVVPGSNGTETFGSPSEGTEFIPYINDSGIVVFEARIAIDGVIGLHDAIFAYDLQGNLLTSIKFGDEIEVAPGDIRTITELGLTYNYDDAQHVLAVGSGGQDGRPSPLNDRNELTFHASFGAFDGGIFVTTVPEPSSIVLAALACCSVLVSSARKRGRRKRSR